MHQTSIINHIHHKPYPPLSPMTATTDTTRSPHMAIPPSQSLEDLHFNLAHEITKEMTREMTRNFSPVASSTTPPRPVFDSTPRSNTIQTFRTSSPHRNHSPGITKSSSPIKIHTRAPIVKPSPAEEELVHRIHRKVGGPSKLSTYDDPAKVRHVVIEALATEQLNACDTTRIRKGQLTVFERRVVRTVTNRGAAVRSRMRQRKEVAHLKHELQIRDNRVRYLENIVRSLCLRYSVPLPEALVSAPLRSDAKEEATQPKMVEMQPAIDTSKPGKPPVMRLEGIDAPDYALNQDLFGVLVDQMITHPPWC